MHGKASACCVRLKIRRVCSLSPRLACAAVFPLFLWGCVSGRPERIIVGSKNFTEQSILGELVAQQIERETPFAVDRKLFLGGTLICHNALAAGELDLYVEYTGTAYAAILKQPPVKDPREVYRRTRESYLREWNIDLTEPLGFNNTFAIIVRGQEARSLGLDTISSAAPHTPRWRAGFGPEFMERADGFRGLASLYGLSFREPPRIMDLGLSYRALAERQVDLIAGDSTNGLIDALDLYVLQDDLKYFPPYEAVPFVRVEALSAHHGLREALAKLGGRISDETMRRLNFAVDGEKRDVKVVVREFLEGLAKP